MNAPMASVCQSIWMQLSKLSRCGSLIRSLCLCLCLDVTHWHAQCLVYVYTQALECYHHCLDAMHLGCQNLMSDVKFWLKNRNLMSYVKVWHQTSKFDAMSRSLILNFYSIAQLSVLDVVFFNCLLLGWWIGIKCIVISFTLVMILQFWMVLLP